MRAEGAPRKPHLSTRDRVKRIAQVALAVAGVVAVVLLVRQIGVHTLLALVKRALPWMPALLALELVRIGAETIGTRAIAVAADDAARRLDWGAWLRMHLVANAALVVLPAGRTICEGIKMASISAVTSAPRAAGIVVVQHSMTLLALAAISVPCAIAAWVLGAPVIALAVAAHAALCVVGMVGMILAARHAKIPAFAAKWFVHAPDALETFRETVRGMPWFPPGAFGAKLLNRAVQAVQYVILLVAVGGGFSAIRGFHADGVNLVGSALGEFMPAQVGAMDGSFAYAATSLGVTVAMAMAIATLARLTQLSWSAVGALVPVIVPVRAERPSVA